MLTWRPQNDLFWERPPPSLTLVISAGLGKGCLPNHLNKNPTARGFTRPTTARTAGWASPSRATRGCRTRKRRRISVGGSPWARGSNPLGDASPVKTQLPKANRPFDLLASPSWSSFSHDPKRLTLYFWVLWASENTNEWFAMVSK